MKDNEHSYLFQKLFFSFNIMYGFTTTGDWKLIRGLVTLIELTRGREVQRISNGSQVGEVVWVLEINIFLHCRLHVTICVVYQEKQTCYSAVQKSWLRCCKEQCHTVWSSLVEQMAAQYSTRMSLTILGRILWLQIPRSPSANHWTVRLQLYMSCSLASLRIATPLSNMD